jgi:hypothetical protein
VGESSETSPVVEGEEGASTGAFNPVTGEINWDCPCLGGMAHGPCGPEFREAFSCFVYSEEEPKGINCVEKFRAMQDCFRAHPDVYGEGKSSELRYPNKQSLIFCQKSCVMTMKKTCRALHLRSKRKLQMQRLHPQIPHHRRPHHRHNEVPRWHSYLLNICIMHRHAFLALNHIQHPCSSHAQCGNYVCDKNRYASAI